MIFRSFVAVLNKQQKGSFMNQWNYNTNQRPQGGLFENIGEKLKTLAKVFFIIQTVFYFLMASVLGVASGSPVVILIALLIAGFLTFSSWIICSVLYGYGEMIDGIAEIAKNTRPSMPHQEEKPTPKKVRTEPQTNQVKATYEKPKQSEERIEKTKENNQYHQDEYMIFNCPYCGKELAVPNRTTDSNIICPHCEKRVFL